MFFFKIPLKHLHGFPHQQDEEKYVGFIQLIDFTLNKESERQRRRERERQRREGEERCEREEQHRAQKSGVSSFFHNTGVCL